MHLATPATRRNAALIMCALAAVPLAACTNADKTSSGDSSTAPASSSSASTTSASKPSKTSQLSLAGVPADLQPLATAIYSGSSVPATPYAGPAVKAFKRTGKPSAVTGTKASWKGTPIAVLTSGSDTTFAVRSGGTWKVVGGWWPSLSVSRPFLGGKQFVMFMGSDARVKKGQNILRSNADALQLVGTDGKDGGGVLGIARDLWVPVAGGGMGKINSGMSIGGPENQMATLRNVSGVPVRSYLLTGFDDFIWMINAMGGVTINSHVGVQTQHGYVKKGKNKLDGLTALWYSRERHRVADGDFGRSFDQGTVLLGIAAQTRAAGPAKLVKVLGQASGHVHTNLTAEQALLFGADLFKVNPAKVGHSVAKGPIGTSKGGASIVVFGPQARAKFADMRDGRLGG